MANLPFFAQSGGIEHKIETTAKKAMQFHSFAKEWKTAITAVWLLKFFTASISIYAGAGYLSKIVIGAVQNLYVGWFAAIILLFTLESINATALFKGFKFTFRKKIATAIAALLIAMLSFSVSFFISVNGIEQMQTAKADDTTEIEQDEKKAIERANVDFENQIKEQQNAIALIQKNPQGWQNGKRSVLTRSQLSEIAQIRTQISILRQSKAESLKQLKNEYTQAKNANLNEAKADGAKYYKLVSILMFIQLFANFALTFFYAKVYTETEKEKAENEDLTQFAQGLFANMYEDVKNRYANLQHNFTRKANEIFADVASAPVSAPLAPNAEKAGIDPANTPLTPQKSQGIGFQNRNVQQSQPQNVAQGYASENSTKSANYYFDHRPQLCEAIIQQAQGEFYTTNRELANRHGCSEATVRNCRRAIINQVSFK